MTGFEISMILMVIFGGAAALFGFLWLVLGPRCIACGVDLGNNRRRCWKCGKGQPR